MHVVMLMIYPYPSLNRCPIPSHPTLSQIFQIHTRTMNCERDIRFELLARLCPNSTGADIRSVCTEAGMYAVRGRRKTVTEKDFLDAVNKVGGKKASRTGENIFIYRPRNISLRVYLSFSQLKQTLLRDLSPPILQVIKGYQKFSATPKYMVYN